MATEKMNSEVKEDAVSMEEQAVVAAPAFIKSVFPV